MLKKLSSPWFGSIMGLICFLGVTVASWNAATANIGAEENEAAEPRPTGSDQSIIAISNVEVDALIKELKEERETLAQREKNLNELSSRLDSERSELSKLTNAVHRMQKEFELSVTRITDEEAVNLKKIAKTYTTMEPEAAAGIFKQMEDKQIVKIMMLMKEAETAPILASLSRGGETEAKRAADLTDRLRLAVVPKKK